MNLEAAHAVPIAYDEALDGDLDGQVLGLDAGTNTVTGTMSLQSIVSGDLFLQPLAIWDLDPFVIDVSAGQVLTSISLDATLFGDGFGLDFQFFDGASTADPMLASEAFLISCCAGVSLSANLFTGALPLSVGQYLWNPAQEPTFLFGTPGTLSGFDYTVTFNVSALDATAVPEPGAFSLFALALLGFLLRRPVLGDCGGSRGAGIG